VLTNAVLWKVSIKPKAHKSILLHRRGRFADLECSEMSIAQTDFALQEMSLKTGTSLDLFSIRQTNAFLVPSYAALLPSNSCINNAPFFAYQTAGKSYAVVQGNCHSWSCPRCGINRAKQEYGRIVEGCRSLAEQYELYFITLTCRGKELSLAESEAGYYGWTNTLLTALRTRAKRKDQAWHYVQATERQKRGHPHSHMLTTFVPHDLRDGFKDDWKYINKKFVYAKKPALRSDWLEKRCISAGLGSQYDISKVDSVESASRYVAKYMFKDSMFLTDWPKNWRRVRYSNSFPKLEKQTTDAFVLMKKEDWLKLAKLAVVVRPRDEASEAECLEMLRGHSIIIDRTKKE